jgi:hypothetical protein
VPPFPSDKPDPKPTEQEETKEETKVEVPIVQQNNKEKPDLTIDVGFTTPREGTEGSEGALTPGRLPSESPVARIKKMKTKKNKRR